MAYDGLDRQTSVQDTFGSVLTYYIRLGHNRTLVQDSFGGNDTRTN